MRAAPFGLLHCYSSCTGSLKAKRFLARLFYSTSATISVTTSPRASGHQTRDTFSGPVTNRVSSQTGGSTNTT